MTFKFAKSAESMLSHWVPARFRVFFLDKRGESYVYIRKRLVKNKNLPMKRIVCGCAVC